MNKKNTIIALFIGLIIFLSLIILYINKSPNLKFSTGKCDADIDFFSAPHEGILNQKWKNDSTLIIEGYVKTFCGGAKLYGDYSLNGNNLILKYEIKTENAVTTCACPHKVIYEISNLKQQNYSISIINK